MPARHIARPVRTAVERRPRIGKLIADGCAIIKPRRRIRVMVSLSFWGTARPRRKEAIHRPALVGHSMSTRVRILLVFASVNGRVARTRKGEAVVVDV